jgi:hypothetical protein
VRREIAQLLVHGRELLGQHRVELERSTRAGALSSHAFTPTAITSTASTIECSAGAEGTASVFASVRQHETTKGPAPSSERGQADGA